MRWITTNLAGCGCNLTARKRRLLQPESETPKSWRETDGEKNRVVAIMQRPPSLAPDAHGTL